MNYKIDLVSFRRDNDLTQIQVSEALGIKQGSYSEIERGLKPISEAVYEALIVNYGRDKVNFYLCEEEKRPTRGTNLIPIVPISAMNNSLPDLSQIDCEMLVSPIKNSTLAIRMRNDSMENTIPRGSLVIAGNPLMVEEIAWGKPYYLDTKNGQIVAYIYPSKESGKIKCVFANERYPSFEINKEVVRNYYGLLMYLVEL